MSILFQSEKLLVSALLAYNCAKVLDILSHLEIFLSFFVASSVSPFPILIHLSLCI